MKSKTQCPARADESSNRVYVAWARLMHDADGVILCGERFGSHETGATVPRRSCTKDKKEYHLVEMSYGVGPTRLDSGSPDHLGDGEPQS